MNDFSPFPLPYICVCVHIQGRCYCFFVSTTFICIYMQIQVVNYLFACSFWCPLVHEEKNILVDASIGMLTVYTAPSLKNHRQLSDLLLRRFKIEAKIFDERKKLKSYLWRIFIWRCELTMFYYFVVRRTLFYCIVDHNSTCCVTFRQRQFHPTFLLFTTLFRRCYCLRRFV